MRFALPAFAAILFFGFLSCGAAQAQRLEPYQTYAETGLSLNYSGYLFAEDAYLNSLYNGFENVRAGRAYENSYDAYYYGQNAYAYLHVNKYIQARDAALKASERSYVNFNYLYTYVIPFGTTTAVYDFTVATYYAFIYNYYAAAYYEAAFHSIIP